MEVAIRYSSVQAVERIQRIGTVLTDAILKIIKQYIYLNEPFQTLRIENLLMVMQINIKLAQSTTDELLFIISWRVP